MRHPFTLAATVLLAINLSAWAQTGQPSAPQNGPAANPSTPSDHGSPKLKSGSTQSNAQGSTSNGKPTASTSVIPAPKMTEAKVRQKLRAAGYTHVELRPASGSGASSPNTNGTAGATTGPSGSSGTASSLVSLSRWTGTAMKDGKKINIEVDPTGKVTDK